MNGAGFVPLMIMETLRHQQEQNKKQEEKQNNSQLKEDSNLKVIVEDGKYGLEYDLIKSNSSLIPDVFNPYNDKIFIMDGKKQGILNDRGEVIVEPKYMDFITKVNVIPPIMKFITKTDVHPGINEDIYVKIDDNEVNINDIDRIYALIAHHQKIDDNSFKSIPEKEYYECYMKKAINLVINKYKKTHDLRLSYDDISIDYNTEMMMIQTNKTYGFIGLDGVILIPPVLNIETNTNTLQIDGKLIGPTDVDLAFSLIMKHINKAFETESDRKKFEAYMKKNIALMLYQYYSNVDSKQSNVSNEKNR